MEKENLSGQSGQVLIKKSLVLQKLTNEDVVKYIQKALEQIKKSEKLTVRTINEFGINEKIAFTKVKNAIMSLDPDKALNIWKRFDVKVKYRLVLIDGEKFDYELVRFLNLSPKFVYRSFLSSREKLDISIENFNDTYSSISSDDSEVFVRILESMPLMFAKSCIEETPKYALFSMIKNEIKEFKRVNGVEEYELAIRAGLEFEPPIYLLNWLMKNNRSRFNDVVNFYNENSVELQEFKEVAFMWNQRVINDDVYGLTSGDYVDNLLSVNYNDDDDDDASVYEAIIPINYEEDGLVELRKEGDDEED